MRKFLIFFIAVGLLLAVAACSSGPDVATPTAIPLEATATRAPRPTRPVATAAPTQEPPTPTLTDEPSESEPTPAASAPSVASELDRKLAKQTVQSFLNRLTGGDYAGARRLYLTDRAQEGAPGQLLAQFAASGASLEDMTLNQFLWATDTSYEAEAELCWAGDADSGPATQSMMLVLAYQRGLWLIDDIVLGKPRAVAPTPTRRPRAARPASGYDGKLVFQASTGGDIYTIALKGAGGPKGTSAAGRGLERLTDGLDPAWSPDGAKIALGRWRAPWGIYLVDPQTGSEERVVDSSQLKEVAWSPDGRRLAFTINYGSSESREICFFGFCFTLPPFSLGQIWLADLESGELLSLPLDDRAVHSPTWSADGERIVYAGDQGLAWIDLDDMSAGRFGGGSVWDTSPAFSPDGRKIAFMGRVHNRWEIFVMNADGSGRRQLTFGDARLDPPPSSVAPAWSPDGQQIAFLSNRDGPWRIYVMDADGSGQQSLFGASLDDLGIRYEWASERVISWGR